MLSNNKVTQTRSHTLTFPPLTAGGTKLFIQEVKKKEAKKKAAVGVNYDRNPHWG